ncbi:hypothetical protein IPV08_05150 [Methylobacterium sp. SD274]|uniref:hypothetical protein n=1 Tax=Methylobacterium sp. SD274 TaxID=2782009 RepID=UPI001A96A142|nr:hypothetical protein [Methylobacterium sp. SD274]MBO1019351.1 hypothetical protein [Methylobacterium sp. SD274]
MNATLKEVEGPDPDWPNRVGAKSLTLAVMVSAGQAIAVPPLSWSLVRIEYACAPFDGERSRAMTLSPFIKLDLVRLPDGRVGAIVGVWNLGEAYEVDVGGVHETWSTDDLTPTA